MVSGGLLVWGGLAWSGLVSACFCWGGLRWFGDGLGWSGIICNRFCMFWICLGGGHRWFGLFWGGLGWPGFVSARSKVVWDSQGSGAVWGGLGWSGLVALRFRAVWGCLGWSGVVRLGSSLGSFQFVWGWSSGLVRGGLGLRSLLHVSDGPGCLV